MYVASLKDVKKAPQGSGAKDANKLREEQIMKKQNIRNERVGKKGNISYFFRNIVTICIKPVN
jgi:hypothetical protein